MSSDAGNRHGSLMVLRFAATYLEAPIKERYAVRLERKEMHALLSAMKQLEVLATRYGCKPEFWSWMQRAAEAISQDNQAREYELYFRIARNA